jgi:hypothetical protein
MSGIKTTNTASKQTEEKATATSAQDFYVKPEKKSMRDKLAVHSAPSKRAPLLKKEQECCCRATD